MPSFTPENVLDISLNYDTKKYFLTYHIAKESIWYSEKKNKIKVINKQKEISKESVELIKELYEIAISKTKYTEKDHVGFDGVTYYFSINSHGQKTGLTWSPKKGTIMAELVRSHLLAGSDPIEFPQQRADRARPIQLA